MYTINQVPPDKIAFRAKLLVFTSVTVDRKKCKHHEMSSVYLTSKIKPASLSASPVISKYAGHAGHVWQTSADVRQRAETLPDIYQSSTEENV